MLPLSPRPRPCERRAGERTGRRPAGQPTDGQGTTDLGSFQPCMPSAPRSKFGVEWGRGEEPAGHHSILVFFRSVGRSSPLFPGSGGSRAVGERSDALHCATVQLVCTIIKIIAHVGYLTPIVGSAFFVLQTLIRPIPSVGIGQRR